MEREKIDAIFCRARLKECYDCGLLNKKEGETQENCKDRVRLVSVE